MAGGGGGGDGEAPRVVLEDEVEGDIESTDDFLFFRIGEAAPLFPSSGVESCPFNLEDPPSKPIAVSDRFATIFLAHQHGFLVMKTKNAIEVAKGVKESTVGALVDRCHVDVRIGRVSALVLSGDSEVLAVIIGGEIHFFYVTFLLNKEKDPSFSCSLSGTDVIQDFIWQNSVASFFVVLANDGSLYHGTVGEDLKNVMENVDAVSCSREGDYVAVAKEDAVNILSENFENVLCLSPLFGLSAYDADSKETFKVDFLGWVRDDIIVVGCVRVNEDGLEEDYHIQVIVSQGKKFSEPSCAPTVFSFPNLFGSIVGDVLPPTGVGSRLLLGYLDEWQLFVACHKKNVDQHIVLLKWSFDGTEKEVLQLEFQSDKHFPRIDLQENGDDNVVLGFGLERVSLFEKINVLIGADTQELSPRVIVLFMSLEGKLIMYHSACVSDPSDSTLVGDQTDADNEVESTIKDNGKTILEDIKSVIVPDQRSHFVKGSLLNADQSSKPDNQTVAATTSLGSSSSIELDSSWQGSDSSVGTFQSQTRSSLKTASADIQSRFTTFSSSESLKRTVGNKECSGPEKSLGSIISPPSGFSSAVKASASVHGTPGSSVLTGSHMTPQSEEKMPLGARAENANAPHSSGSQMPLLREELSILKPSQTLEQSPLLNTTFSKAVLSSDIRQEVSMFYDISDMTEELDALLFSIESEGGFRDACAVYHKRSSRIAQDLLSISESVTLWKTKLNAQLARIQDVRNKMLEVSARQIYMEGVLNQSSDGQYWDLWNHQKLAPEFELKRENILKANQSLASQLLELEKHFNALEISKFGATRRASHRSRILTTGQRSQAQSLQSIYKTLKSQLAAAEHLSESLSKQIAMLNISPPQAKKEVAKELFVSIGLHKDTDASHSPDTVRTGFTSKSRSRMSEHIKISSSGSSKGFEPETARRRRESLDTAWTSLEPQKTTLKRPSRQRFMPRLDKLLSSTKEIVDSGMTDVAYHRTPGPNSPLESSGSFLRNQHEGIQDQNLKQGAKSPQSSIFRWARDSSGSLQHAEPKHQETEKEIESSLQQSRSSGNHLLGTPQPQKNISLFSINSPYTSTAGMLSSNAHLGQTPFRTARSVISLPKDVRGQVAERSKVEESNHTVTPAESKIQSDFFVRKETAPEQKKTGPSPSTTLQPDAMNRKVNQVSKFANKDLVKTAFTVEGQNTPTVLSPSSLQDSSPSLHLSVTTSSVSASPSIQMPAVNFTGSPLGSEVKKNNDNTSISSTSTSTLPTQVFPSRCSLISESSESSVLAATPGPTLPDLNKDNSTLENNTLKSAPSHSTAMAILTSESNPSLTSTSSSSLPISFTQSASQPVATTALPIISESLEKNDELDNDSSEDAGMEEEASDASTALDLGALGGFRLGSAPSFTEVKANPFGPSFVPNTSSFSSPFPPTGKLGETFRPASLVIPSVQPATSTGDLFRPASLNIPSVQPASSTTGTSFANSFSGAPSGFGQPAQIGSGNQALGSVLGSFGQSRQLGISAQGAGFASTGGFGGGTFSSSASGGFGGFAAAAKTGGFAAAAAAPGGGFAAAAAPGGGFGFGAAATGGGFAAATGNTAGVGFAGAAGGSAFSGFAGGFGGLAASQGSGFSAFGANSSSAPGRPPANILTQMRK